MDLLTLKILALLLLVCVRMCVGLGPIFVCRNHCRSSWVDLGVAFSLSFAGGVLLATCFIHLVPQVRAALHYFLPDHTLPITELLIVAGFFFTFFLDEACISFRSSSKIFPASGSQSPSLSMGSRFRHIFTSRPHNILRTLLLAIHSFAKGVAVGIADSPMDLWFLVVATAIHQSVTMVGFTLHLMKLEETTSLIVLFNFVVVVIMVVGAVIGIVVTSSGLDAVLVAVVRGLAAGNIMYVTFYELLTRDIRARALGLLSHFLALIGFLIMLALQLIGIQELKYMENVSNCLQKPSEEPSEEPEYDNEYSEGNRQ